MGSSLRQTADEVLRASIGQGLDDWLLARRAERASYEEIARDIYTVTNGVVEVSYQTIKRWLAHAEETAAA